MGDAGGVLWVPGAHVQVWTLLAERQLAIQAHKSARTVHPWTGVDGRVACKRPKRHGNTYRLNCRLSFSVRLTHSCLHTGHRRWTAIAWQIHPLQNVWPQGVTHASTTMERLHGGEGRPHPRPRETRQKGTRHPLAAHPAIAAAGTAGTGDCQRHPMTRQGRDAPHGTSELTAQVLHGLGVGAQLRLGHW